MKAAVIFVLFFATVLCRPARKASLSSSESSEEVARRPAPQVYRKQVPVVPQARAAPVQAAAPSAESAESSEEPAKAATTDVTSDSVEPTSSSDTASVNSESDEDDDSDEIDENDTQEEEDEEDDSTDSSDSESGELSTASPTDGPVVVTAEPVTEIIEDPFEPTVIIDTDSGRGDSFGGYPSDYKSIIYPDDKSYHKKPDYYKSYEYVDSGKKSAHGMIDGNDVEKSLKVYKVQAYHVHSDFLDEDTSTPEVESQGLDTVSGPAGDQYPDTRQAILPVEEDNVNPSEATTSDSSSGQTEEVEEESTSTSQESQDEESQSSEEATATPGAADSDSDESESTEIDSEEAAIDTVTDMPVVVTAK